MGRSRRRFLDEGGDGGGWEKVVRGMGRWRGGRGLGRGGKEARKEGEIGRENLGFGIREMITIVP